MRQVRLLLVPGLLAVAVAPAVLLRPAAAQALHKAGAAASQTRSCAIDVWSVVPSPNGTGRDNQLFGVTALSPYDVWAVGDTSVSMGPDITLTEHWNGSAWSMVPSPNVSGASSSFLTSVSAVSSPDVWAVGYYYDSTLGLLQTLAEHWNGTTWTIIPTPNVPSLGGELYGVSAHTASDIWAVGFYFDPSLNGNQPLAEHWNGTTWSIVAVPGLGSTSLYSAVAIATNDVWAVGNSEKGQFTTLVEHWDGTSWTIVTSPNGSTVENYLYGVTAVSASDVWAVGSDGYSTSLTYQTLIEHWNGSTWSIISSANAGSNSTALEAAAAIPGSNRVWSVGSAQTTTSADTYAEQWNGTSWNSIASPQGAVQGNQLLAVAATGPNDAWAVGSYIPSTSLAPLALREGPNGGIPTTHTLIEHYHPLPTGRPCV